MILKPSAMNNTIHTDNHNKQYRKKYKYMKLRVKNLILENAALCDEVAKIQENIQIVKEERKFLLCKLLEYENDADTAHNMYSRNESLPIANGSRGKQRKKIEIR